MNVRDLFVLCYSSSIMSELDKALKARIAARGWVTRSVKSLKTILATDPVDKFMLELNLEQLDKRLSTLYDVQMSVELYIDVKNLDADIIECDNFLQDVEKVQAESRKRLSDLVKPDDDTQSQTSVNSVNSSHLQAKLPRLELPKFGGDLTEWQSFWDKFTAMVDQTDLAEISKFSYLQSLLTGEAKAVIDGFATTAKNYTVACKMLVDRYGRKECIVFAHIQGLLNMSIPSQGKGTSVTALWKLQDELLKHTRSLEALGVNGEEYGMFLTPVILSRLPSDIRMEWARDSEGRESDLAFLLEFLSKEIKRRERSETFKDMSDSKTNVAHELRTKPKTKHAPSASALTSNSSVLCGFCGKNHLSEKCWSLNKLSVDQRYAEMRKHGLCFRCLTKGHISKGCQAVCENCNGRHHKICCYTKSTSGNVKNGGTSRMNSVQNVKTSEVESQQSQSANQMSNVTEQVSSVLNVSHSHEQCSSLTQKGTVLQTAKVMVHGVKGNVLVNIVFDSGADNSYISGSLVKKIRPEWVTQTQMSYSAFGGKCSRVGALYNVFKVELEGLNHEMVPLNVFEVGIICKPLVRSCVPSSVIQAFSGLNFADSYESDREVSIDILIGLDSYWRFVRPNAVQGPGDIVAQETIFGWILSGSWQSSKVSEAVCSQLLCLTDVPESMLRKFWI